MTDQPTYSEVVAIVGSRTYPDLGRVVQVVNRLKPMTLVVSGGARGPDTVAVQRAEQIGLFTKVFNAGWEEHGKKAGYLRNKALVEFVAEHGGRLIAFHATDPKTGEPTRGTAMTIGLAREAGVKVNIYRERSAEADDGMRIPDSIERLVMRADELVGRLGGTSLVQAKQQLAAVALSVGATLRDEQLDLEAKLNDGWDWLRDHPEHERYEDTEHKWRGYKRSYEAVTAALIRLKAALEPAMREAA